MKTFYRQKLLNNAELSRIECQGRTLNNFFVPPQLSKEVSLESYERVKEEKPIFIPKPKIPTFQSPVKKKRPIKSKPIPCLMKIRESPY